MKNTIRCCISCILPCGALDVIRIVHSNGRVEEITGTICAAEVMKAHPKHILKKPTTRSSSDAATTTTATATSAAAHRPTIIVVPPDAQLQRGKIYFLIPITEKKKKKKAASSTSSSSSTPSSSMARKKRSNNNNSISVMANLEPSDQYLSEIMSEKISTNRERRRGRVGIWRPHLESISETLSEAASSDR